MKLIEDPVLDNINSKLKRMRIMKGLTQESLSELSGVNIKSIAAYEQSPEKIKNASVGTIYKLADSLNCDIEDLINKENI